MDHYIILFTPKKFISHYDSVEVLYVSKEWCFMHIVRVLVIPAFIFAIVMNDEVDGP